MMYFFFVMPPTADISPATPPDDGETWHVLITITFSAGLLACGYIWGARRSKELYAWYLNPGASAQPASLRIKKLALNQPAESAFISMAMWFVAGVLMGLLNADNWQNALMIFSSVAILTGSVVGLINYFLTERIWGAEMPIFFPEGDLRETSAFRITVRRRISLLFVMMTLPMIVLAFLDYAQTTQIAQAANPVDWLPHMLRLQMFVVGVGVLMAVTLSLTLGASLVQPIESLRERMSDVRRGDLDAQLPVTQNDELGDLIAGFNAMLTGLRQEQTIRHLFSLYVTPEVATHAITYGAELGGQLTEATVLFADIRSFTGLTEQLGPEAIIDLLNRYFNKMSEAITRHGGLVNKFGGDSLLAVFGTPLNPEPAHATRAVQAAQAMLKTLDAFNAGQRARGEPALRIGIGVATGPIVAGNVGSEERLEYTVIGDTVNVASRLESLTKSLATALLVSETTARALTDAIPLQAFGEIEVRGKQQPLPIYGLPDGGSE